MSTHVRLRANAVRTEQDFWDLAIPEPNSGCLLWEAGQSNGYGMVLWQGKQIRAHCLALAFSRGQEMPTPGVVACHTCDVRPCINPEHLYGGTDASNAADAVRRDRHARGSRQPGARLTEEAAIEIRSERAEGRKQRELAARFGVTQQTISRVDLRKAWLHI